MVSSNSSLLPHAQNLTPCAHVYFRDTLRPSRFFGLRRFEELAREKIKDPATLKAFTDWLVKFECTIEGCDRLSEPSINGLTHYKTCDGDATLCWKQGGYNNIVNILLVR
ncbi:unnamed protein product, partial [Nesidiocoris tenuis]